MSARADAYEGPYDAPIDRPAGGGPRTRSRARREQQNGAGRTGGGLGRGVIDTIRQLPNYGKLLAGLLMDRRVSTLDKALVGAAVAYLVSPVDLIPDFIPLIGEFDELFVLVLALHHLVANADPKVVIEHWGGDLDELEQLDMRRALTTAAFFFPRRLRRRLRVIGRFD
jgi:uncharacterized membrane protein YkvA (DUF1232 family)